MLHTSLGLLCRRQNFSLMTPKVTWHHLKDLKRVTCQPGFWPENCLSVAQTHAPPPISACTGAVRSWQRWPYPDLAIAQSPRAPQGRR